MPKKKIKIKCFNCSLGFKEKKDIFRDQNNNPICIYCLEEQLLDYWEDDFLQSILQEIKNKFNGSYNKWKKWFYETHELCNGDHEIEWYVLKSEMVEVDGLKYCSHCIDMMDEKEKEHEVKIKNE